MSTTNRVFTLREKSDALGDILSDALDGAGISSLDDTARWEAAIGVMTEYLDALVVHHWRASPPTLVMAAPAEPWIIEAVRFALAGRGVVVPEGVGPDGAGSSDVSVFLTTLH
jgi:hypothetical protein